jgi:hypothetical protein
MHRMRDQLWVLEVHARTACHAPGLVAQDALDVIAVIELVVEAWRHIHLPLWVTILPGQVRNSILSSMGLLHVIESAHGQGLRCK